MKGCGGCRFFQLSSTWAIFPPSVTLLIQFLHHSCVVNVPFPRDRGDVAASANPLIKYFMLPAELSRAEGNRACVSGQKTEILPFSSGERELNG